MLMHGTKSIQCPPRPKLCVGLKYLPLLALVWRAHPLVALRLVPAAGVPIGALATLPRQGRKYHNNVIDPFLSLTITFMVFLQSPIMKSDTTIVQRSVEMI